jgi:hypothetical protein
VARSGLSDKLLIAKEKTMRLLHVLLATCLISTGAVAGLVVGLLLMAHPAWAAGVVGDGTAASCTDAALNTVLSGGGSVTFDCGANIEVTEEVRQ